MADKKTAVREAGRKGGLTTSRRYGGSEFFKQIGIQGGKRTRELIAAGKRAEQAEEQKRNG